jgi:TolA-binding protein
LQQSAQQREKVLGAEHKDTLSSKYWLAYTLYKQKKYAKAEQLFRQSAQQQKKMLRAEHKNTLQSKY